MRSVAAHVPGAGILRDSQKFVIPWMCLLAVAFGCGVDRALDRLPARRLLLAGVVLAAVPLALAPTLAFGAWGRLHTASYPPSWDAVQEITASDRSPGAILVLPWHAYFPFPWNHGQVVHQPAPLYFGRRVVAANSLEVSGYRLPDEDPWSRLVEGPATDPWPLGDRLAALGIRYVVVFSGPESDQATSKVAGLPVVRSAPDLRLYRVPGLAHIPHFEATPAAPVVAGDVAATGLTLFALGAVAVDAIRRRRGTGVAEGATGMLAPDDDRGE
jgi:hypothetical protein